MLCLFPTRILFAVLAVLALQVSAHAIGPDSGKETDDLEVIENLNNQLPLGAEFKNERGRAVSLRSIFDGKRPAILSLNYSNCPLLCQTQLTSLVGTLNEIPADAGDGYEIVSISLDPTETTQRIGETKQRYFADYGRQGTEDGWNFLIGNAKDIQAVAKATGIKYRYLEDRNEYIHPAVLIICTPDGKVSRYIYGVTYDTATLRLSLVEAGKGKTGSSIDKAALFFCFAYDETTGKYAPAARKIMRLGAMITILCIAIGIGPFWIRAMLSSSEPSSQNRSGLNEESMNSQAT